MTDMHIGVFVGFEAPPEELENHLRKAEKLGFSHVQIWAPREDDFYQGTLRRRNLIGVAGISRLKITSMFAAFPGIKKYWNAELPNPRLSKNRTIRMKQISDLSKDMNIEAVSSHIGYIPANRESINYRVALDSVGIIADHCRNNGQQFRLETGMESAVILRQFIIDVNRPNVKVNLDPANLLMSGFEGPIQALDQLGEFVVEVHLKDGKRFESGIKGYECPLGQGDVDFMNLLGKLKTIGFKGVLTIEREILGDDWAKDVISGRKIIENMMDILEIS